MSAAHPSTQLRLEINTAYLWSLAVGLVISGEYFGWNYGWGAAGTVGFLYTTLIVAVLDKPSSGSRISRLPCLSKSKSPRP